MSVKSGESQFQKELLAEDWTQVANHPQIQVKRIERDGELYVFADSANRVAKSGQCGDDS